MAQSYEKAGVNLEAGYEVVRRIKKHVASTSRPGVMGNIGAFGGMFDLSALNVKEPVLVSGTDGVGTKLITSDGMPSLGGVYKLAAIEDENGNIIPKIKISENVGKITNPHFKKVYRFYSKDSGMAEADYICLHDEVVDDTQPLEICDPDATWKKKVLTDFTARELLVPIFRGGRLVYQKPALDDIRAYCAQQLTTLWPEVLRFDYPHNYYVDLSEKLLKIKLELLNAGGKSQG